MQEYTYNEIFYKRLSRHMGTVLMVIAALVMTGWLLNVPALKSISPGWVSMKWNTALCFFVAGLCILLINLEKPPPFVKLLIGLGGWLVATMGFLTLVQYLVPVNFGIDEWFVRDNTASVGTSHPGRFAPLTAIAFILAGLSFFAKLFRRSALFQSLHFAIALIALLAFTGYLFDAKELTGFAAYTVMAFSTSICFLILSHAAACAEPGEAFMRLITSKTFGGRLFRNTFPWLVTFTLFIGWLRLKAEAAHWFGTAMGVTLFVMAVVTLLAFILYNNASYLTRAEKEINLQKDFSNSTIDSLPGIFYFFDQSGKFLRWNKNLELVSGFTKEEIKQMQPLDFILQEERPELMQKIREGFLTGEVATEATLVSKDGRQSSYFITGRRLDLDGYSALIGMGIDVSERKKAEAEIGEKIAELERFNKLAIGREMKMIELKKEVNELHCAMGKTPPYNIDFVGFETTKPPSLPQNDFTEN